MAVRMARSQPLWATSRLTTHNASPPRSARRRWGRNVPTVCSTWDTAGTGLGTGHLQPTGRVHTPSLPEVVPGRIPVSVPDPGQIGVTSPSQPAHGERV